MNSYKKERFIVFGIVFGIVIFLLTLVYFATVNTQIKHVKNAGFIESTLVSDAMDRIFENKERRDVNFGRFNVGSKFTKQIDGKLYNFVLVGTRSDMFGEVTGYFEFQFLLTKKIFKITEQEYFN